MSCARPDCQRAAHESPGGTLFRECLDHALEAVSAAYTAAPAVATWPPKPETIAA